MHQVKWSTVGLTKWPSTIGIHFVITLHSWYDNTKKKSRVGYLQLTCHCLHIVRNEYIFLFGSVWYRIDISVFVMNMTTLIYLIHYVWTVVLARKGSLFLVCSTSQLVSRIILNTLVACVVSRQIVYRNCLPLCTMGRKTWQHGDPHAQNYAVCGDDLARIKRIYHFYAPS